MNKEQQQILKEVWSNYRTAFVEGHVHQELDKCLAIEEYINKCKTDNEFSQELGLKIEERELSLEERMNLIKDSDEYDDKIIIAYCENPFDEWLEGQVNEILIHRNIPTKVITITYKENKIETYE